MTSSVPCKDSSNFEKQEHKKMATVGALQSPILLELQSDLEALNQIDTNFVTDEDTITLSLCKTLESAFRHGLIRESRENSDFFDVVLSLFDQQNSIGSKLKFILDQFIPVNWIRI